MKKYSKEECIRLLQTAQLRLESEGRSGFVSRKDFSTEEVVAIKAYLGPWPRALEAARIKEPREVSRKDLNRQRRIRSKRKRRLQSEREAENKKSEEKNDEKTT